MVRNQRVNVAKNKKKTIAKVHVNAHVKRRAFLAAFAECGIITRAASMANVSVRAHYLWMENPEYARKFQEVGEMAADKLEEEARRRAHDGLMRMKFHQGQAIIDPRTLPGCDLYDPKYPGGKPYMEMEYSDTLLIFMLKGARPTKFRDNVDLTTNGKPFVVKVLNGVTMDEI